MLHTEVPAKLSKSANIVSNHCFQIILDFLGKAPQEPPRMFPRLPMKLMDCKFQPKGVASELLIVEGDSASSSVGAVRDESYQAVLPIQGKPLNAWKASKSKVAANAFYQAIIEAIGAGWGDAFELEKIRYQKIILIFDPDADGIHCSMLVLMFFYRWMRPLLDDGRIHLVHPPMFEITANNMPQSVCAANDEAAVSEVTKLTKQGFENVIRKRFRGLGSMGSSILSTHCVDPSTRVTLQMRESDVLAAIAVFSPNHSG